MLISHMEGRADWPRIVESVVCPACHSQPGSPCRNLSANPFTLAAQKPRNDWHQERKFAAVKAWNEYRERVMEESSGNQNQPESGSQGKEDSRTGGDGLGQPPDSGDRSAVLRMGGDKAPGAHT